MRSLVQTAVTDAPPATIRFSNRDITTLRATIAFRPPTVRQLTAERLLSDLATQAVPVTVTSRQVDASVIMMAGSQDLFVIVPADLDPSDTRTVQEEAQQAVSRLQLAMDEAVELRTPRRLAVAGALTVVATIALIVLLRLVRRGHVALLAVTSRAADRQLQRLPVGEVMRASRLPEFLRYLVSALAVASGLMLTYFWLTFVLRRFPYTRPWGEALRGFLVDRVAAMGRGMLDAMPDLFTVLLIVLLTRFAARLTGMLFDAVEAGRASLPWVYPETAQPSRRLVTAMLWVFALAMSYPYLPGANTDAFKGVSVFIGLMISLGSSGIVNQLMSGFTLTYSRALRVGDFVRIGDVEGTVTQLGTLSTKLKTPRREEVTIPNAVVVGAKTTNYSRFAESEGVLVPTSITIGYDAPWRQVEALLLLAAARTKGVKRQPAPVVRQTALRDFYVEYTLLVALEDPAMRAPTLDRLHGHIQDAFNEHGVQIMSPNYEADPEGPKLVPRERWFAAPAVPGPEQ